LRSRKTGSEGERDRDHHPQVEVEDCGCDVEAGAAHHAGQAEATEDVERVAADDVATAMSRSPRKAAVMEVATSGMEVPRR